MIAPVATSTSALPGIALPEPSTFGFTDDSSRLLKSILPAKSEWYSAWKLLLSMSGS